MQWQKFITEDNDNYLHEFTEKSTYGNILGYESIIIIAMIKK